MELIPFGKRLKQVREEKLKLSQSELAKRLGYLRNQVYEIEHKKHSVSFSTVNYISKKLDMIPVGFYYFNGQKWILDDLSSKKFWQGTLDNYIGDILREYRIKKRLEQRELGEMVGVAGSMISHLEVSRNLPLTGKLENICSFLEIVPYYLLEKLVRFDQKDHEFLKKAEFILNKYHDLSHDHEEIRKIIVSTKGIKKINESLEGKYNKLAKKVIFK